MDAICGLLGSKVTNKIIDIIKEIQEKYVVNISPKAIKELLEKRKILDESKWKNVNDILKRLKICFYRIFSIFLLCIA